VSATQTIQRIDSTGYCHMLAQFMIDGFQGIWKDMEVDVAYSWHPQVIRQKGMKKVTKIAARIIDEKARLERGVP